MSRTLVLAQAPNPRMAAQLHQCVLSAGAISAASAILCGLELTAIKTELKKTQVLGFLEWFDQNQAALDFSKSTKDNYMKAAATTKAKLLKSADPTTLRLLEGSPSTLMPSARAKLLEAVKKCIDGDTLMEVYLEAGIVKPASKKLHKADPANNGSATVVKPKAEQQIHDQLWLPIMGGGDGSLPTVWAGIDDLVKAFHKTTKDGAVKAPLWQFAKDQEKRDMLRTLETKRGVINAKLDAMIAPLKEALKK